MNFDIDRYKQLACRLDDSDIDYGSGVMPKLEVRHLITHLFGDDAGRDALARIDRRIGQLPGLAGMQLVTTASRRWTAEPPASRVSDPGPIAPDRSHNSDVVGLQRYSVSAG